MGPLLMAVIGALLSHGGALARPQTEKDAFLGSLLGDTSTSPEDNDQFNAGLLGDTSTSPEDDDQFITGLFGDTSTSPENDAQFIADLLGSVTEPPCANVAGLDDTDFLSTLTGDCTGSTPPPDVVRCERGQHVCAPYFRCDEADIVSDGFGGFDVRIGKQQFERDFDFITHSECPRFGDVCCTQPKRPEDLKDPEPYVPQCGRRNQLGINARIVGFKDNETQFGEIPWMVAVLHVEEVGGEERNFFECGGSLIHPQVVMTAAHCVHERDALHRLRVRLGEWDTQQESERFRHVDVNVARVAVHEDFRPLRLSDNVALLFLEEPVELQEHIDTLCLPDPDVVYDQAECIATGWGKDAFVAGQFQTVLKQIELPLVPHAACQAALRKTRLTNYFVLDRSFRCAGGVGGQDTCTGDGGSPLACRDPRDPDRYIQLGVVSWGIGCGTEGVPGVYADVAQQVRWIREQAAAAGLTL
ncbi:phenoloxidase-activating factor 2-like [Pollicipes pollicipes]|uniref:phenoloxidase-activating factor 2-like n=1 Tax=Pollicipes pollicipes TaxID=41117 RepID=UPI001884F7E5|nr:phenoloxidase-activating factor 2-like [Pollicipes pollicipes]